MNPIPKDSITHLNLPFEAYVGNQAFIFVSYAHRDSALVYPEIERLHRLGFRIWYDEGIEPGNDWSEDVASALDNCAFFLVFISPRAVESKNVRNEINYAINHNKPFLAVHLEETSLPKGLELRTADIQAIHWFRMSEERYYRQINKALAPYPLIEVDKDQSAPESARGEMSTRSPLDEIQMKQTGALQARSYMGRTEPIVEHSSKPVVTLGHHSRWAPYRITIWVWAGLAILGLVLGLASISIWSHHSAQSPHPVTIQPTPTHLSGISYNKNNAARSSRGSELETTSFTDEAVKQFVENWRLAWQNHNLNQFMALYARQVDVNGKIQTQQEYRSYHESENRKQPKMSIDIKDIKLTPKPMKHAEVSFHQLFRGWGGQPSDNWTSSGFTTLMLEQKSEGWKITGEYYKREWGHS